MTKKRKQRQLPTQQPKTQPITTITEPSKLKQLPVTYQEIYDYYEQANNIRPFPLRKETFKRIEKITNRPLICYVAKTHNIPSSIAAHIEDLDLVGFRDLINSVQETSEIDVLMISNGGSAEASERIVKLLHENFTKIRFILPANAFSAATLISFSGDEIIMGQRASLGPIDPQINGIPTRAILNGFEAVKVKLQEDGPQALPAYVPLLEKYDLHLLEMCQSFEDLSKELAQHWLTTYMFKDKPNAPIKAIVDFFSDYDFHKSHSRSIDRNTAKEKGLKIIKAEEIEGLADLLTSLDNQYEFWFDKTAFYKMFEDARGISWGRQAQNIIIPAGLPQNTLPKREK